MDSSLLGMTLKISEEVPEEPIPEQDPVVTKSYAMWYVVCMVILMATLFWALWDEAWVSVRGRLISSTWKDSLYGFPNNGEAQEGGSRNQERLTKQF